MLSAGADNVSADADSSGSVAPQPLPWGVGDKVIQVSA
jgi:hypothetical protein